MEINTLMNEVRLSAIKKLAEKRNSELTLDEYEVLSGELQSLLEYQGPDRIISNAEYWQEKGSEKKDILTFHPQIWNLDNFTQGFRVGELWSISGPTKHGKTTLCETIGRDIQNQGGKVLWFFYEMPEQFMERHREENGVFYIPREQRSNDLEWLKRRVLEARMKHGVDAIFIDHLHFLVPFRDLMHNASISIGNTLRILKSEIAVDLGVVVFLVAHTTKSDFSQEPNEGDIRDSSFISQESDGTIMVFRKLKKEKKWTDDDPFSMKSKLIVCNTRRTGVMNGKINLVKKGNYLYEEEQQNGTDLYLVHDPK